MDIFEYEAFKSNYIKTQDLNDKPLVITIESVSEEKVGDDVKPVIRMQGMTQGWVLNLTNTRTLVEMFGTSEDSEWIGRKVELYPTTTTFSGKTVPTIRCRAAIATPADFDDELPADL